MLRFPGKDRLRSSLASLFGRRARCLFILSTGRCGTTTLAHLLENTRGVDADHEPHPLFLQETFEAWMQFPRRNSSVMGCYGSSRMRRLVRAAFGRGLYAECSNRLTYLAYDLRDWFPNARFVHLFRDPSYVIRSAMRRGYYAERDVAEPEWRQNRVQPRPDDPLAAEWTAWSPFQKCCWYWAAVNEFAADFVQDTADRAMTMRAEDLFEHGVATYAALCSWSGIRSPDRGTVESLLARPANSQTSGAFATWDQWTDDEKRQMIEIAGKVAVRLGYNRYDVARPETGTADVPHRKYLA